MKFGGTSVADSGERNLSGSIVSIQSAPRGKSAIQPESPTGAGRSSWCPRSAARPTSCSGVAAEAGAGDADGARENVRRAARTPSRGRRA